MTGHAHAEDGGNKRIALLIAVIALCLALVETGAKSTQTEALTRNVEAANLWAFFQARTIRQTAVRTAAEQAELDKLALTDPAARTAVEAQQKAWRDMAARWDDDPKGGEGRKQLSARAQDAERVRALSLAKYHMYEYSAAAFQVAIVVVSASVITGVALLTWGGVLLAAAGAAFGMLGAFAPNLLHL